MNRGFVFTTDVLIGTSLLLAVIFTFGYWEFESTFSERSYERLSYVADDTMVVLSHLKAADVQNKPTIKKLISENVITESDLNKTVLDLIASFWYADNKSIARNISEEILGRLAQDFCIALSVDGGTIYSSCNSSAKNVAVSARIETGYEVGRPSYGYIVRAFLTSIKNKTESRYAYFGGFVGEGNITTNIDLPNFDKIEEAYMELDAGSDFDLYINGNYSGSYAKTSGNMSADQWKLSSAYISNFNNSSNTISFNFTGSRHYIGGGYFRVTYNTSEMDENAIENKYFFPGIYGFINLYSSFYVPGTMNSMNASLHYFNNIANSTILFTIGNATVYRSNATGEQKIFINRTEINSSLASSGMNYQQLGEKTVPIRLGLKPMSYNISVLGDADVILITDLSGSMIWKMNSSSTGNMTNNCSSPLINSTDARRVSVAKCLDKEFIDIIMNVNGDRMGLVGFSSNANVYTPNLSSTRDELINHINNYTDNPSGSTCICCAINRAYNLLNTYSNASRDKYIIVMTDGIASECCGCGSWFFGFCTSCSSTGTSTSSQYGDCSGTSSDCTGNDCSSAMQNANYSSCRVHNLLNATVNSIGFGPVATCTNANWTLKAIASCGNGSYYASSNAEELEQIYRNLADSIAKIAYHAQTVTVEGNATMGNVLYPDSCIEFNYTPSIIPYEYGEISLTRETAKLEIFNGSGIDIPYKEGWFDVSDKVKVVDAKITSYSSEFWTDRLYVENSLINWTKVYWLGDYGNIYQELGDPYIVQIPVNYISSGNNSVRIGTGLAPDNATGGSPDDRIIYTVRVKGSVGYGNVFNNSEAATNDAVQRLIDQTSEYVDTGEGNIVTETKTLRGIRWLWGPSLIKTIIWEN